MFRLGNQTPSQSARSLFRSSGQLSWVFRQDSCDLTCHAVFSYGRFIHFTRQFIGFVAVAVVTGLSLFQHFPWLPNMLRWFSHQQRRNRRAPGRLELPIYSDFLAHCLVPSNVTTLLQMTTQSRESENRTLSSRSQTVDAAKTPIPYKKL